MATLNLCLYYNQICDNDDCKAQNLFMLNCTCDCLCDYCYENEIYDDSSETLLLESDLSFIDSDDDEFYPGLLLLTVLISNLIQLNTTYPPPQLPVPDIADVLLESSGSGSTDTDSDIED